MNKISFWFLSCILIHLLFDTKYMIFWYQEKSNLMGNIMDCLISQIWYFDIRNLNFSWQSENPLYYLVSNNGISYITKSFSESRNSFFDTRKWYFDIRKKIALTEKSVQLLLRPISMNVPQHFPPKHSLPSCEHSEPLNITATSKTYLFKSQMEPDTKLKLLQNFHPYPLPLFWSK